MSWGSCVDVRVVDGLNEVVPLVADDQEEGQDVGDGAAAQWRPLLQPRGRPAMGEPDGAGMGRKRMNEAVKRPALLDDDAGEAKVTAEVDRLRHGRRVVARSVIPSEVPRKPQGKDRLRDVGP
jgi:hypothetical protein